MSTDVHATVTIAPDGTPILHDSVAAAIVREVDRFNCKATLSAHAERVRYFVDRVVAHGLRPEQGLVLVLNGNDPIGGLLASLVMPVGWDLRFRDEGQVPWARGLCDRAAMTAAIATISPPTAAELHATAGVAILVVDHDGALAVFTPEHL